ncbi:MAG: VWA domain-containing protein [Deltaproteobacteria bacterium]|nr:VWA domain-containing protein [Deltaproteobacteria bacterium]
MREALTDFLQEVRAAGVPISLAEAIDALRAATTVGVEREPLREALAAAVVKDEADRDAFDEVFERFFAPGERRRPKRAARRAGIEAGSGRGRPGEGIAEAGSRFADRERRRAPSFERDGERRSVQSARGAAEVLRRRRRRELLRKVFRDLDAAEAEEMVALAAELARRFRARLTRRLRRSRRGRLDFRRTLRRSIAHGGAAFHLALRRRRPARPDLVALCDASGSVRHAAELFAALLAPCREYFRRMRLLLYVDAPVEASVENGRLVPHGPIDVHAFSDLGRVLVEVEEVWASALTRNTVLVVLGDARNNRRPARADVLGRLRARVRALWWLVPEPRARWGTGDSAIESYRPHCDAVLECASGAELLAALDRLAR